MGKNPSLHIQWEGLVGKDSLHFWEESLTSLTHVGRICGEGFVGRDSCAFGGGVKRKPIALYISGDESLTPSPCVEGLTGTSGKLCLSLTPPCVKENLDSVAFKVEEF